MNADPLLFESKNDMFTVDVSKSSDRAYILIDYHSKTENEVHAINVKDSLEKVLSSEEKGAATTDAFDLQLVRPLAPDVEYSADHAGSAWFLKTKEGCKQEHFRVMRRGEEEADFSVLLEEDPVLAMSGGLVLTKSYLGVR